MSIVVFWVVTSISEESNAFVFYPGDEGDAFLAKRW
jgi:hypothetical protein